MRQVIAIIKWPKVYIIVLIKDPLESFKKLLLVSSKPFVNSVNKVSLIYRLVEYRNSFFKFCINLYLIYFIIYVQALFNQEIKKFNI